MSFVNLRQRHPSLEGNYQIRGSYRLTASTGAVTTIAAATATAGHLFAWRWSDSTARAWIKYVGAKFICTTAYTSAQETAADLIVARSYSVSDTGGTAIDVGSTVAHTGNYQTQQLASLVVANSVRIATASALTAGTHTLDANPLSIVSGFTSAVGITVPPAPTPGQEILFDGRGDNTPLELNTNEGFKIRNLTLMGAVGVGRWDFTIEWDEGVPVR